jgi:proline iminopeptidase
MKDSNQSGTINISGFKLNYLIEGKGIPVLVIGSSVYYPRVFSAEIKKHLQLIHVDHRGFVPPPSDNLENSDIDLDVLVEDIETIRKHLALDNFIIMGYSGHAFYGT